MGLLLDKPVMDRLDSRNGGNTWISYGMSAAQGYRQTMEDRSAVHLHLLPPTSLPMSPLPPPTTAELSSSPSASSSSASVSENGGGDCLAFFGVFDGHGGEKAAEFAAARLLDTVMAVHQQMSFSSLASPQPQSSQDTSPSTANSTTTSPTEPTSSSPPQQPSSALADHLFQDNRNSRPPPPCIPSDDAIIHGFLILDHSFRTIAEKDDLRDGCTAVTSFVHYNASQNEFHIVVPNVGDSRCVLSREGTAFAMSDDHKPTVQTEFKRIMAAGGTVFDARVQGDLALSRAIGDFSYKSNFKLPADQQMVISKPEFKKAEITYTPNSEEDSFLILACDGVWDVMTNQEAVDFVKKRIHDQRRGVKPPSQPTQSLATSPSPVGIAPLAQQRQPSSLRKSKGAANETESAPARVSHPPCPCGINLAAICDDMIDSCINDLGSKDNISVIIVLLHKKPALPQSH